MIVKGITHQEYGSYTWIYQTLPPHNIKWKTDRLERWNWPNHKSYEIFNLLLVKTNTSSQPKIMSTRIILTSQQLELMNIDTEHCSQQLKIHFLNLHIKHLLKQKKKILHSKPQCKSQPLLKYQYHMECSMANELLLDLTLL